MVREGMWVSLCVRDCVCVCVYMCCAGKGCTKSREEDGQRATAFCVSELLCAWGGSWLVCMWPCVCSCVHVCVMLCSYE